MSVSLCQLYADVLTAGTGSIMLAVAYSSKSGGSDSKHGEREQNKQE